ncbi:MAG: imidazoleglycerol-phosphate dehydratase HisB [Odoribacter sp.]|nr:imidazoleglycerol-phosphate dehydratase HisB [Odoribacter sp.]
MKKKTLFINFEGAVLKKYKAEALDSYGEDFELTAGVISALKKIYETTDYRLILIDWKCIDKHDSPEKEKREAYLQLAHRIMVNEGIVWHDIISGINLPCCEMKLRLEKYLNEVLDYENSYFIGNNTEDMQLADEMEIEGILLRDSLYVSPELPPEMLMYQSWGELSDNLIKGSRRINMRRITKETDIEIEVDLNNNSGSEINTGLSFFDHMLEQIARHGKIGLKIKVSGDLEVDEHHTIEDTGLVLGQCFREALGSKKGIERYAFALPMDESKAEVLLDFGGRSHLEWNVNFDREYVGDFPTEMAKHFFASFCQESKSNLHVSAEGENSHHIMEAIFKAFARCIGEAVKQTGTDIPSSKGII